MKIFKTEIERSTAAVARCHSYIVYTRANDEQNRFVIEKNVPQTASSFGAHFRDRLLCVCVHSGRKLCRRTRQRKIYWY